MQRSKAVVFALLGGILVALALIASFALLRSDAEASYPIEVTIDLGYDVTAGDGRIEHTVLPTAPAPGVPVVGGAPPPCGAGADADCGTPIINFITIPAGPGEVHLNSGNPTYPGVIPNGLFDGYSPGIDEHIYLDSAPVFGLVFGGETRLSPGNPGGPVGSLVVCPADPDCGLILSAFTATERHEDFGPVFGSYDPGEAIYDDLDQNTVTSIGAGAAGIDPGEVVSCVSVPVGFLVDATIVQDDIPPASPPADNLVTWGADMFYDDDPLDPGGDGRILVTAANAAVNIGSDGTLSPLSDPLPDDGISGPNDPGRYFFSTLDVAPYSNITGPGVMATMVIDTSTAIAGNYYTLDLDETDPNALNIAFNSGPLAIANLAGDDPDAVIAVGTACPTPTDLEITAQAVPDVAPNPDPGVSFNVTGTVTVVSDNLAGVDSEVTTTLVSPPADCLPPLGSVTPDVNDSSTVAGLGTLGSAGAVVVPFSVAVTCANTSQHDFVVRSSIAFTAAAAAAGFTDPDATNNTSDPLVNLTCGGSCDELSRADVDESPDFAVTLVSMVMDPAIPDNNTGNDPGQLDADVATGTMGDIKYKVIVTKDVDRVDVGTGSLPVEMYAAFSPPLVAGSPACLAGLEANPPAGDFQTVTFSVNTDTGTPIAMSDILTPSSIAGAPTSPAMGTGTLSGVSFTGFEAGDSVTVTEVWTVSCLMPTGGPLAAAYLNEVRSPDTMHADDPPSGGFPADNNYSVAGQAMDAAWRAFSPTSTAFNTALNPSNTAPVTTDDTCGVGAPCKTTSNQNQVAPDPFGLGSSITPSSYSLPSYFGYTRTAGTALADGVVVGASDVVINVGLGIGELGRCNSPSLAPLVVSPGPFNLVDSALPAGTSPPDDVPSSLGALFNPGSWSTQLDVIAEELKWQAIGSLIAGGMAPAQASATALHATSSGTFDPGGLQVPVNFLIYNLGPISTSATGDHALGGFLTVAVTALPDADGDGYVSVDSGLAPLPGAVIIVAFETGAPLVPGAPGDLIKITSSAGSEIVGVLGVNPGVPAAGLNTVTTTGIALAHPAGSAVVQRVQNATGTFAGTLTDLDSDNDGIMDAFDYDTNVYCTPYSSTTTTLGETAGSVLVQSCDDSLAATGLRVEKYRTTFTPADNQAPVILTGAGSATTRPFPLPDDPPATAEPSTLCAGDTDGDGILDVNDFCVLVADDFLGPNCASPSPSPQCIAGSPEDAVGPPINGDGCPENLADTDADGIVNANDPAGPGDCRSDADDFLMIGEDGTNAPNTNAPGPPTLPTVGDGCPESLADTDGDSISNANDPPGPGDCRQNADDFLMIGEDGTNAPNPNMPGPPPAWAVGDGCPENLADTDGDAIANANDPVGPGDCRTTMDDFNGPGGEDGTNSPNTNAPGPPPSMAWAIGDGCPENLADSDGDAIANNVDACRTLTDNFASAGESSPYGPGSEQPNQPGPPPPPPPPTSGDGCPSTDSNLSETETDPTTMAVGNVPNYPNPNAPPDSFFDVFLTTTNGTYGQVILFDPDGGGPMGNIQTAQRVGHRVTVVSVSKPSCSVQWTTGFTSELINMALGGSVIHAVRYDTAYLDASASDVTEVDYQIECTAAGTTIPQPELLKFADVLSPIVEDDYSDNVDRKQITNNALDTEVPPEQNDLVAGMSDNCPYDFNPSQADNEPDGLGDACDPDDDNDGILDGSDACPFDPEDYDGSQDADGCPDAPIGVGVSGSTTDVVLNVPDTFSWTVTVTNSDPFIDADVLVVGELTSDPFCIGHIQGQTVDFHPPATDDHISTKQQTITVPALTSQDVVLTADILCDQQGSDTMDFNVSASTVFPVVNPIAPATDSDTLTVNSVGQTDLAATSIAHTLDASQTANVTVAGETATLNYINNGPDSIYYTELTVGLTVNPPADCDVGAGAGNPVILTPTVGATDDNNNDGWLDPFETGSTTTGGFSVACSQPSNHSFVLSGTIDADPPFKTDPNTGDNTVSANHNMTVTASADASIGSMTTACTSGCGAQIPLVGDTFEITVTGSVQTTDPDSVAPVNADVTLGLTGPADCTLTATGGQSQSVGLTTSPQVVSATWDVSCTVRSDHDFNNSGSVTVNQNHVTDGNASNNTSSCSPLTMGVWEESDLAVTSSLSAGPTPVTINLAYGTTATFTVDTLSKNLGPAANVNANTTVSDGKTSGPPQCGTSGGTIYGDVLGPDTPHTTVFTVNCAGATTPATSTYQANAWINGTTGHVYDPNSANDTASPPIDVTVNIITDQDGDGVDDSVDNCPPSAPPPGPTNPDYNPDQADSDGDGAGDVCDTDGASHDVALSNIVIFGLDTETIADSIISHAFLQVHLSNLSDHAENVDITIASLTLTGPTTCSISSSQLSPMFVDFEPDGRADINLDPDDSNPGVGLDEIDIIYDIPVECTAGTAGQMTINVTVLADHDDANHPGANVGEECAEATGFNPAQSTAEEGTVTGFPGWLCPSSVSSLVANNEASTVLPFQTTY